MKLCRICQQAKPLNAFYPRSNSKDGRRSDCIKCKNSSSSEWIKGNRIKARVYSKNYRDANREVERARHTRNYSSEWHAKYRSSNPHLFRAKHARRRAAKRKAIPIWAASEFDLLVIDEAYLLTALREYSTGIKWHVDHIYPLISNWVCGFHCGSNIQVIPWIENVRKGNKRLSAPLFFGARNQ